MNISWSGAVDERLSTVAEPAAWQDFHEASKLPAVLARQQAGAFAPNPVEAFVMSRAFRQQPGPGDVALPRPAPAPAELTAVLRQRRSSHDLSAPVDLPDAATVLSQALGPTFIGEDVVTNAATAYRAWPSAGALYPLDIYLLARTVVGLQPGCYHVNLIGDRLEPVRTPPVDEIVTEAFFWQDFAATAAAMVLLVAVFERSVAKYGERGYRFTLLDAGHAAQNLLLVAQQQQLHAVAVGGFDDDALAAAIGLDGLHRAVVHTVMLGGAP